MEIKFNTIKDFLQYCKKNKISKPFIQLVATKHQTMSGKYLHEIFGTLNKNESFSIDESYVNLERKYPKSEGYSILFIS